MPQIIEISGIVPKLGRFGRVHKKRKIRTAKRKRQNISRKVKVKRRKVARKKAGRRGKIPIRSLRGPKVKISSASPAQVRRVRNTIRTAKIKKATFGIRLALLALANGRFMEAGNIAINSAIEAAAAFKQDPKMATRIITTARGVVRAAIRKIARRSV